MRRKIGLIVNSKSNGEQHFSNDQKLERAHRRKRKVCGGHGRGGRREAGLLAPGGGLRKSEDIVGVVSFGKGGCCFCKEQSVQRWRRKVWQQSSSIEDYHFLSRPLKTLEEKGN